MQHGSTTLVLSWILLTPIFLASNVPAKGKILESQNWPPWHGPFVSNFRLLNAAEAHLSFSAFPLLAAGSAVPLDWNTTSSFFPMRLIAKPAAAPAPAP